MSSEKVEIVDPKKSRTRPLKLAAPVFDEQALRRANAALEHLSNDFQAWLERDTGQLQQARLEARDAGWTDASLETLYTRAHDLKGLAGTYGYPIITDIAYSLCRLIETDAGKIAARGDPSLCEAHVDAIRAAARDDIKTAENPVGRALLGALHARVEALGVAPPG